MSGHGIGLVYILVAFFLAGLGGWWIAARAFDLHRGELAVVGFSLGLVLENWLANVFAQFLPIMPAIWLASLGVFACGLALARPWGKGSRAAPLPFATAAAFLILVLVFTAVGRGLGIFDEFQTIPAVSTIATGNLPLHFMLNPRIFFGYHYFLLLLAAQLTRLGGIFPWSALDLARAITLAFTLLLATLLARRLTGNRLAAVLSGFFVAFATSTRWLLLLLPAPILNFISARVQMTGAGLDTAQTLAQALPKPWVLAGTGTMPFPFAFADGVSHPLVLAMNGIGPMALMIMLLLALTADRRRSLVGSAIISILTAALALANEVSFALLLAGFLLVLLGIMVRQRSLSVPERLRPWFLILLSAGILALIEGGVFTGLARGYLPGNIGADKSSLYSFSAGLNLIPSLVTVHFGRLSAADPAQLLVALTELSPVLLIIPLLAGLWLRSLRRARDWYALALIGSAAVGLVGLFVTASANGAETVSVRFIEHTLWIAKIFAVPLAWIWLRRQASNVRIVALLAGLVCMLGGIVHFGIGLASAGAPMATYFISDMDTRMAADYWDRLEPGALVFDPNPVRAPTVFGRLTDGFEDYSTPSAAWSALAANPDPYKLRAAGFTYVYFDQPYWQGLGKEGHDALGGACVRLMREYEGVRGQNKAPDFRRLLDIRACQ